MNRILRITTGALLSTAVFLFADPSTAEEGESSDPPVARIQIESGNPLSGDPEAIQAGEKLYGRWCVQCHGFKLDGVSPRWGKTAFDLRLYFRGYEEFVYVVSVGRLENNQGMPPFGEFLTLDDINSLGAFIETRAMEGANWK